MSDAYKYGPFHNDESTENVAAYQNPAPPAPIEHEAYRAEITDYFRRRHARLQIVKTTRTPHGQIIDWIPIESQHPKGVIASPPPNRETVNSQLEHQPERFPKPELEDCERGPSGTVPVVRKNLKALGYNQPLKQYLSKMFGAPVLDYRGGNIVVPGPDGRGTHRSATTHQRLLCFGGEGQFSCFDPYVDSSDELSLIQLGLSNSDLPA